MKYGEILKFCRVKKGFTQLEVSEGICSVTHLSKIENGYKEVNIETLDLLFKKLDLTIGSVQEKYQFLSHILESFNKEICNCNFSKAQKYFNKLNKMEEDYLSYGLISDYYLLLFKYCLYTENTQQAGKYYAILRKSFCSLNNSEAEKFIFLEGIMLLKSNQLQMAKKQLIKCFHFTTIDKADFYYYYAIANGKSEYYGNAMESAIRALEIYKQSQNYIRILHANLLLGIILMQLESLGKAQKYFEEVLYKSDLVGAPHLKAAAFHNLGIVMRKLNKIEKAKFYLKKSLKYNKSIGDKKNCLNNLMELMHIQSSHKNQHEASKIIEEVLRLSKQLLDKDQFIKAKIESYKINKENNKLEKYLLRFAIPYFEKQNSKKSIIFCYKILLNLPNSKMEDKTYKMLTQKLLRFI
ncbi:helix-turn-helix domain-containing protein [Bacillus chungangensis]|uniref:Transcriptional regulator with XRE-family HTH domain n=1 Tax=Bacillus chungangensis TaxID=587633 RepID=A0ABT9WWI0_9BACI|nr:tetratricopeptide repeat protein [Bacillus chungangensis]MDQ0177484.1 transcriptional regulator with XRE-family HTH domain [Bacillus chungangensis]